MFPRPSVAVQVTTFVPTGNCDGALLVTRTEPQLSLTVGLLKTIPVAKHEPIFADNITSAGQVIVGSWVSLTVTVKVHSLTLPLLSVAVLVTVVTPSGKVLPLMVLLTRFVTVQLSVAVTVN